MEVFSCHELCPFEDPVRADLNGGRNANISIAGTATTPPALETNETLRQWRAPAWPTAPPGGASITPLAVRGDHRRCVSASLRSLSSTSRKPRAIFIAITIRFHENTCLFDKRQRRLSTSGSSLEQTPSMYPTDSRSFTAQRLRSVTGATDGWFDQLLANLTTVRPMET
jgi:hypothetical protein